MKTTIKGESQQVEYTKRMAEYLAKFRYEEMPEDIIMLTKHSILDTLGIMLGGWLYFKREKDSNLERYIELISGPSKEATAIGYNVKLPVMSAAFVNGTLVETLDWQDCVIAASLHSCSGTIPAILALGEKLKVNGKKIIEAVAAGYEVGTRVGKGLMPSVWRKGFETTGNVGAIGAAMAAGRLFEMNGQESASLLGIASYIAPVAYCDGVFHGFSMKPIHGGAAAQIGIQAAFLRKSGFEGVPLEGLPPLFYGFMNVLSDDPKFNLLIDGLGEEWLMRELAFKKYPVGLLIIGPVEVTLGLVKENDMKASDVKSVNITSYSDTYHFVGRHYTNTSSSHHDCVLSLPYCVAAAISDRKMSTDQLLPARIKDQKIHELASKVKCNIDKTMDELYPKEWPVLVKITLNDGTTFSRRVDSVIGSPSRPMSTSDLEDKFQTITGPILGMERAKEVCEMVLNIQNMKDISTLIDSIAPSVNES